MNTFLCGVLGGLMVIGLAVVSAGVSWGVCTLCLRLTRPRRQPPREPLDPTAEICAEQQAFRQLQNYSAQQAYGLVDGEEDENH